MKIAVCGSAPSSRMLAPFNDPNWEIWACSPQNYDYPRVDAWFELHSLDRKLIAQNEPYRKVLLQHPRVYVAAPDRRLPNAIVFNPQPLIDKFSDWFFTSSLAWMMAFAIEQKPKEMGIWGVDMSAADEYGYQRAGMHFFIREANRAGIEVIIPPQSDLANPIPLYGFKEQWPMYGKLEASRKELESRIQNAENKARQHEDERLILKGARDYLEYIRNTYTNGPDFWNHRAPDETV